MTRLDRRQVIALGLLGRDWRAADQLLGAGRTSVFDTSSGLAHVLGPLAREGLCERRHLASRPVEWRLTEAGADALRERRAG